MASVGSQDWVISKLNASKSRLCEAPETALARFHKIDPTLRLCWNARTIANVLNCNVIDEARRLFQGVRNSSFYAANGTTYHLLNDCVLWYKQLGDDGLPSNYPTSTALEMMQGTFSFMPQRVLLVVGFQLDEAIQKVRQVVIQRFSMSGQMQFYIELEKIVTKPHVIQMPSHDTPAGTRTRVKVKRGPEQKELLAQEND